METLRKGDKGADVRTLQTLLNKNGNSIAVDGDFGPATDKAVRKFQAEQGLTVDGIVGQKTWAALENTADEFEPEEPMPPVLSYAKSLGYDVWNEPYRLWLFGIRSNEAKSNSFDDTLGCYYFDGEGWRSYFWPGTTDPGKYWLENPGRVEGTAILVEDQYLDTWTIDMHRSSYKALCQRAGEVKVYRDNNRDGTLDENPDTIMTGYFGINIHRSSTSGESSQVDKWSAGCQVFKRLADFNKMMELAEMQVEKTGRKTFSYTLLNEEGFIS